MYKNRLVWNGYSATMARANDKFILKTDAPLRDDSPKDKTRTIAEHNFKSKTNSDLFDGLFAMAIEDAEKNRVDHITDWSFNSKHINGFETGEKWHYIWTRDTAYSAALNIGLIDPIRLMNSLLFKISPLRDGDESTLEIVQDTGSGGSWPISTDRVTWALGADQAANFLNSFERERFLRLAITAVKNTILKDREVVYDNHFGLYRGEQSFLDWREQTYPAWTKNFTLPIGESFSQSTNVCHAVAMQKLIDWCKEYRVDFKELEEIKKWRDDLIKSINRVFWSEEDQLYRSIFMPNIVDTPLKKYDLLGNSLAIIYDIASLDQAEKIVANYPLTNGGAPVVFPQLSDIATYHNKAIWPFVTAFFLIAAEKVKNYKVATNLMFSLYLGSALNLSNMENLRYTDLDPLSTVVNSKRQLWSTAGYLHSATSVFFGIKFEGKQVTIKPFIPCTFYDHFLNGNDSLDLLNIPYLGKTFNVRLILHPEQHDEFGYFSIETPVTMDVDNLHDIVLELKFIKAVAQIRKITDTELIAPPTPIVKMPKGQITIVNRRDEKVRYILNGKAANDLPENFEGTLSIILENDDAESHPSKPVIISNRQYFQLSDDKYLTLGQSCFSVDESGTYEISLIYKNISPVNTGITCALRKLTINNRQSQVLIMPHHEDDEWQESSKFAIDLVEHEINELKLEVVDNMSALKHFEDYTKRGGSTGADNEVKIDKIKIRKLLR